MPPSSALAFGLQCGVNGFSGDGFSATSPTARIGNPRGLCNDGFGAGGFYVGDSFYNNIRWVMSNGTIVTVAGGFGLRVILSHGVLTSICRRHTKQQRVSKRPRDSCSV